MVIGAASRRAQSMVHPSVASDEVWRFRATRAYPAVRSGFVQCFISELPPQYLVQRWSAVAGSHGRLWNLGSYVPLLLDECKYSTVASRSHRQSLVSFLHAMNRAEHTIPYSCVAALC